MDNYHFLEEHVHEVGLHVARLRKLYSGRIRVSGFAINGGFVGVDLEESTCSCCSPDYIPVQFPISYLIDPNYQAIEETAIKEEEERKALEDAAAKRLIEQKELDSQRAQYERLKAKFEV